MVIKPDWNVFNANFTENQQNNFEWMCYQLFCKEFGKDKGIFRYYNQPSLEAEPIYDGNDVIGFQAKFYRDNLSKHKQEIIDIITSVKCKYPSLTLLYFYSNQDWTVSYISNDMKTSAQKDIEDFALKNKIRIEWKTNSFFESRFVTVENSDIIQYFFSVGTNQYYKKIRAIKNAETKPTTIDIFPTSLYEQDTQYPLSGKNVLSDFIIKQFHDKDLNDFPNIFIRGVAGIGKSTEMRTAYLNLLDKCSHENCYHEFHFLPTPYFYELKNYQKDCFKINEIENPILFLDGLDEIPHSELSSFVKNLANLKSQNPSVRFIISGRDASFSVEINCLKHIDIKLSFYVDNNLQNLIYKFKGTVFEPFVGIPFYRTFLCSQDFKNAGTYRESIDALIISRLKNHSSDTEEDIELNSIQKALSKFAYNLFKSEKRVFPKTYLKKFFSKKEAYILLNSFLFDYKDENAISFFSNIYFEYFVARYYSCKNYSLIRKELFISTGKVKIQHLNIIAILLNLLPTTARLHKKLSKHLNNKTSAYILLTDYISLPAQQRFAFYKRIIEEFNAAEKLIYYASFRNSHDILKNIDSLSDAMQKLLPEEFYDEAVQIHSNTILDFIKNPAVERITMFENAVILLGVYNKIWNTAQQAILENIAIPLLKFFREHKFAEKMRGLLSEDIVFTWYEDYGWTENWNEKDWSLFVNNITNTKTVNFYDFESESDFRLKLKLFIYFHKNVYISNLLIPLAIKILNDNTYSNDCASFVPHILDDDFKIPTIHYDNDIEHFNYAIKNYDIPVSDLLHIMNSCIHNHIRNSAEFQIDSLYKEISDMTKHNICNMTNDDISELYKLFTCYVEIDSGMYISKFIEYIEFLADKQKIALFELLFEDLNSKDSWQNLWILYRPIIMLLNISDKINACFFFEKLKPLDRVYRECVAGIYIAKLTGHPLYNTAVTEYPILFPEQIEKENRHAERMVCFESEKEAMLKKEINIILNKELLLDEVNHILTYISSNSGSLRNDSARKTLLDLQTNNIENKIQYDHNASYSKPPLFSTFALKILFHYTDNNNYNLNCTEILNFVNDWFSREEYFWRYFFWLYVCHYKNEETEVLIKQYPQLSERIKKSMQIEVACFIEKQDMAWYDEGKNKNWVVPFVYYLTLFYDNKLPEWFDINTIFNFIAYPAWQLSTGFGVHTNEDFKWKHWNSVVEWIEEVSGIEEDTIIKNALALFPLLKSDQSQSQVITIFVEKAKSDSVYKQQMIDAIITKTIEEVHKDYEDTNSTSIMNGGALSSFWRETENNFIDKIFPAIDFSKYNPDDKNYCRKSVLEYFCKVATVNQKKKVVKLLKNKMQNKNIKIYLAKLGYGKAIGRIIDDFLLGERFDTNWTFYTPLFGKTSKTLCMLYKYCQLYKYSLEKNSERRSYLTEYAKIGIMQTVTKRNFWVVKKFSEKIISERKRNNLYHEGIQDFLNEIEQKIYGSYYEK